MKPYEQPDYQHTPEELAARNGEFGKFCIGVVAAMFLAGFASIPIYRLVCAQVDPGGSSWFTGDPDIYEGTEVDESRQVRVRFATNVERQLPWEFGISQNFATVHPGEKKLLEFTAMNMASIPVTGKAVYDINPPAAAPHFKKIECFCFIEQQLAARQEMVMPLYFWFDPDLPAHVTDVTIGYTFFNSDTSMARAMQ